MTKKIIWRLKESPTAEKLCELVKVGLLNNEEAREILFNQVEETDRTIESYQQEIKFLREIIEKLSSREKIVEIVKEYHEYPSYSIYPWYKPYYVWCGNSVTYTDGGTDTSSALSLDNVSTNATCAFNSISTF